MLAHRKFGAPSLAAAVLLSTVGCGHNSAPASKTASQPVRISLVALARQLPGWKSVQQLDDTQAAAGALPEAVALPTLRRNVDSARLAAPAAAPRGGERSQSGYGTDRTRLALARAQARAVSNIRRRLERETNRLTARYRALQNARVAAGIAEARQQAIDNYNRSLQQLLGPIAAHRINLNIQIAALQKDALPSNPPTAPDEHWAKLLASKQALLARLPQPQTVAQRTALEQITAQTDAARQALQSAADIQAVSYRAGLEERNRQILARQATAFLHEQSDLTTIADQLGSQLRQPLQNSVAGRRGSAFSNDSSLSHASLSDNAAISLPQSGLPNTYAHQRRRLILELLDAARREAAHAAPQLHYRIVKWNAAQPDLPAMARLARRIDQNIVSGA